MDGTVLIADDDRTIRTVLTQAMTRAGARVHATSSLTTLLRWVEEGKGDLVVSDVVMPDGNGIEMMPRIAELRPELPVIVISAQNTIMTAVQAADAKAFDYLPKPFDLPDLMKRARVALDQKKTRAAPTADSVPRQELPLVGRSANMQALYRLIARVMNSDLPILVSGESGSGKSLIARSIHDLSDRREASFAIVDASRLAVIQSAGELRGLAGQGTLVLDEVGDVDADTQMRLARMLDRMGQDAPRVISTATPKLQMMLAEGAFRDDLYFRLSGITLAVPPLRERVDDIPLLASHFLARSADEARQFSPEAEDVLRRAAWPGNVRQLEMSVARLAMTSASEVISATEVAASIGAAAISNTTQESTPDENLSGAIGRHLRRYFDLHGNQLPAAGLYNRILREMELPLLDITLEATGGNQAKAAELLGINRNTLRKKLTELDIRVTRRRKLM